MSRRQFLKGGLLLAGSALLPPSTAMAAPDSHAEAGARAFDLPGTPFHPRAIGRSNPLVVENQKPGQTNWRPTRYQHDIIGFAAGASVGAGERLDFFVDTSAATDARWPSGSHPIHPQPHPRSV